MTAMSVSKVALWIDSIPTPQDPYELHLCPPSVDSSLLAPTSIYACDDKENRRSAKRQRIMENDQDKTPRPSKLTRELDDAPKLPPPSETKSPSSESVSEASETESHRSGRLSPAKQIQLLEDFEEHPVVFCNFDDHTYEAEPEDVILMREAVQRLADGIGILGYDDIDGRTIPISLGERPETALYLRLDASHAAMQQVQNIVKTAREYDCGSGDSEDEWNSEVQHTLLKLARSSCNHTENIAIVNV
ncbi:MAG: hypothetical protein Q9227_008626 [Pyrenula ochraceoflavens]